MIDLTGNENPNNRDMGVDIDKINRYVTREEIEKLLSLLADYSGFSKESMVIDYGTDRLIERVILKYHKNRELYVINPNEYGFITLAKDIGMKVKRIQLIPDDLKIDWEKMDIRDAIFVIDYPNNPTGNLLIDEDRLKKLLEDNIVIIDEAGYEYSNLTFSKLIDDYENLCIVRTLDKAFGLAGIKIGYMTLGRGLKKSLEGRNSLNKPTIKVCEHALTDLLYLRKSIEENERIKNLLTDGLEKYGIETYKSFGNYMLVRTEIPDFSLKLRNMDILIKDLSGSWINGYYRISMGSEAEMKALINAIKEIKK